jgi:dihydroneopterin aldolase
MTLSPARILIRNVELYAYHGAFAEERALGGKYALDIELSYDAAAAAASDALAHAVNYQAVVDCAVQVVMASQRNLLETIAHEVLHALMERFAAVQCATVRLRKFAVPLGRAVEYVELQVAAKR